MNNKTRKLAITAITAAAATAATALCATATLRAGPAAAGNPKSPNIILILIDDMGYGDIGPFGSVKNRTPNLDRMASEGLKLTSFYAAPVCTRSRAQFMTGCYAKRVSLGHGVLFPAGATGLSPKEHTVAELLKAQGYATMAIGKWHLGDQPAFLPTSHGFDSYFGLPYSNDMDRPANAGPKSTRPPLPLIRNDKPVEVITPEKQNHIEERYTAAALQFIREHANSAAAPIENRVPSEARSLTSKIENPQPFFLYLAHTAVHVPIHPGPNFRGKSANGRYGDWVEEVDWSTGQVLDTLKQLGIADNTLVIFTSDNGPWMTQGADAGVATPLRGAKGGTYEGGMREPTIAWWPGKVPAGKTTDAITGNIDILPTFVALAGGAVPADNKIDGVNILPILLGQASESTRKVQYYFSVDNKHLEAVRVGPWKLAIAWQKEKTGKNSDAAVNAKEKSGAPFAPVLYNLETDIGERHDVAAAHPDIVQQLQAYVTAMDKDLGNKDPDGPGVRPPGRVPHPVGLWLPGQPPSKQTLAAHYDTED